MSRSIATRTGDDGSTSLLYGQRVPKDQPQIEAVGAFDELNTAIGLVKPLLGPDPRGRAIHALLTGIQKKLVALMGELACAEADAARFANSKFDRITVEDVKPLDAAVAELESRGISFEGWATPGANALAAALDHARATARRGERRLVGLRAHGKSTTPELGQFVNRLSDLLWLLAREAENPPR